MRKTNPFPLTVVGVGANGPADISPDVLETIHDAEVLVGGRRLLDLFRNGSRQRRISIEGDLDKVFAPVKKSFRRRKTVVLATGDPLYFGIGDYLQRNFPKDQIVVLPSVSALQLAFARIKESWQDARVVSLHGRPMAHLYPALNEGVLKVAILTDQDNHPAAIAGELRDLGIDAATLWVFENLGTPREKITSWDVKKLDKQKFSVLNLVILLRDPGNQEKALPALGLPDESFEKRTVKEGMITKGEVRTLVLAKLCLKPHLTLWDVGACTGSIAIEAKRLCPSLSAWAIERDKAALTRIRRNARRSLAGPIQIVEGMAPQIFSAIPQNPHRVFIGGHGGRLKKILDAVDKRLLRQGRIVINAILPESLRTAEEFFQRRQYAYEILTVEISRKACGNMQKLHPIHIIYGQKKD